jgi:hypothetical protein
MEETNKFKNSMGNRYTRGLFYETTGEDKSTVVYTLKEETHKNYPSLKELYLKEADTTEYSFSSKYLDGYEHWLQLVNSDWFKPYVLQWREELRLKKRKEYLEELEEIVSQGGKDRTSAIRILLGATEKPRESVKRGRPYKDTTEEELNAQRASNREIEKDAKRILDDGQ